MSRLIIPSTDPLFVYMCTAYIAALQESDRIEDAENVINILPIKERRDDDSSQEIERNDKHSSADDRKENSDR